MTKVVSVKFRNRGKLYYFDPVELQIPDGAEVVVETAKGLEFGDAVKGNHEVEDNKVVQPLRPVARLATDDDRRICALCKKREREAYIIGKQKIEAHGLEMKLVDVECAFDGSKILFFFSSEGRVDFRELVRDLASVFHTRIELRQIGVRDEARMLGGIGICGRAFCCGEFLEDFAPVSTKMAKTQSMSLNPAKISGACGRLMCCLRYEQEAYEELVKNVPKNGAFVETPEGYGNVTQINVLRQLVRVKLDGPGDDSVKTFEADEVAAIPGGRPRDGSQPPHVLELKPKKPKEEEPEDPWLMPDMLAPDKSGEEKTETVKPKRSNNHRRKKKPSGEGQKNPEAAKKSSAESGKENRPQQPKKQNPNAAKSGEKPAKQNAQQNGEKSGENKSRKRNNYYRYRKPKKEGGGGAGGAKEG